MVLNKVKSFINTEENHPKVKFESLMDKYKIPVQHFEYSYIEKCKDGKELERIVQILRSGEEGHFPDLTRFAENRLAAIKPKSKLLRQECPVISKEALSREERHEITNDLTKWIENISKEDNELSFFKNRKISNNSLPEVRECKENIEQEIKKNVKRISATDYSSWDKYDPDTEILKMDLEEENMKKKSTVKKNTKKTIKFQDFTTEVEALRQANYEKDKGNEFYRSADYNEALKHYTNSINCKPTLASFTNRALVHIKLKKYQNAIDDCHSALAIDPGNIKALTRKSQALDGLKRYSDALEAIEQVIENDPNNSLAQELADKFRKLSGTTPESSTRIVVEEIERGHTRNYKTAMEAVNNLEEKAVKPVTKKSALKIGNKNKREVIIPIPGTSNMAPPHYITCTENNPKKVREETLKASTPTQIIHLISVDNCDIDDDDSCTVNHLKTSTKGGKSISGKKWQNLEKTVVRHDVSEDKSVIEDQSKELVKATTKKIVSQQVIKEDKHAGGEPYVRTNEFSDIPQDINSPYSFLTAWNSANSDKTLEQHATILKTVDINRIVEVIGCKLDSVMFSTLVKCLSIHFAVPGEVERLHFILDNIVNLPRFDIIALLMSPEDRNSVNTLLNFLKQHGKPVSQNVFNKFFNN